MAATPDRIGRYRVREVLGAGGFATVYRATDERLDVDVAVKVLAENHSLVPDVRERFIEEGRRLRRVQGPGLLEVYDLGDTDRSQPYLVLAWADRGDLAARVGDRRRLGWAPSVDDALVVARSLAEALQELHGNRLVHRDLTPRNLLLRSRALPANSGGDAGPSGGAAAPDVAVAPAAHDVGAALVGSDEQLLLADLGMSKDLARASGLTVAGGTTGFAPPEQRGPGHMVDGRADIWAASALLLWLAVDAAPADVQDCSAQVAVRAPTWPPDVAKVLERGLAVDPDQRPATVDMWLAELEAAFVPPPPPPPALPSPQERGNGEGGEQREQEGQVGAGSSTRARLLTLAALGVGGLGGWLLAQQPSVEDGAATATIDGPTQVVAGEQVALTAEVEAAASWMWVAPDGSLQSGAELTFEPVSAGQLTVRVVAVDTEGRVEVANHDIRVVE